MVETTLIGGVTMALTRAMRDDPNVVVFGEDVGANGGVFRATHGLLEEFGKERVIDAPLAELAIGGISIGMAAAGLRPVAEIQFMGFIYPVIDQIVNHAARLRNRTRGRLSCPMVLRAPFGGGIHAPEHHSESTEAMFAHMPGLRVVIPSSPQRAYGLLLAAIRDPDPVIFLEPKRIYRAVKQEVEDDGVAMALDDAFVLREGGDITLVTWGAMVKETLEAADALRAQGVSAEVIDVATLKPLDANTILGSVEKTGRGTARRARAAFLAGPGRARGRLRYDHADVQERASLHAEHGAYRGRGTALAGLCLASCPRRAFRPCRRALALSARRLPSPCAGAPGATRIEVDEHL
jgi:pyruvate dehydrogenase E1 component beta subunit